ncbi:winged helix-turn-helix domain-containing protein [Klebsiella michiganensis]|uniref:winged helix-turn-helix domain-containing protein n=1 Tax=Klebsiella michiganensis TaxID=1134687 RepID=UPI000D6517FD|nr:winged helix-turn-helix domain-containing protein [Klebsiella michiganensis]ELB7344293.1 winged helix-turn-helix domain-containing protein [Klebsiella michiganensis]ELC2233313.1 winged helix-turn-helix domain-containing protein [Klebsiella michiganensis]ELJ6256693.1 winged helix-turn-helix domain-containing protein [Klebsiella michiganensis]MDQ2142046.1 winged helix-turn-helix domain-containing protein [Klebsiella michiganensis]MDV6970136.1 winged helix-turn-helix domain-containing protein 
MIYKIQGTIHFRSDDGLLWLDEDSCVTLTATTSRLLKFLLDHREHVVYRNEILEKVWDAHGLRTSSHSLNKYISDLRAVFRSMGCVEEIIVTVPRVGFMVSASILIERVDNSAPAIRNENDAEAIALSSSGCAHKGTRKFSAGWAKMSGYALLALFVLVILFWSVSADRYRLIFAAGQDEGYYLGSIESCPVRTFNAIPNEQLQKMMVLVRQLSAKQKMVCLGNSVFYFNISESVLKANEGRVFLAHCIYSKIKPGALYSCENYYRPDYEIPE